MAGIENRVTNLQQRQPARKRDLLRSLLTGDDHALEAAAARQGIGVRGKAGAPGQLAKTGGQPAKTYAPGQVKRQGTGDARLPPEQIGYPDNRAAQIEAARALVRARPVPQAPAFPTNQVFETAPAIPPRGTFPQQPVVPYTTLPGPGTALPATNQLFDLAPGALPPKGTFPRQPVVPYTTLPGPGTVPASGTPQLTREQAIALLMRGVPMARPSA